MGSSVHPSKRLIPVVSFVKKMVRRAQRKVQEVLGRPLARLPGGLPEPQGDRQSGSNKEQDGHELTLNKRDIGRFLVHPGDPREYRREQAPQCPVSLLR